MSLSHSSKFKDLFHRSQITIYIAFTFISHGSLFNNFFLNLPVPKSNEFCVTIIKNKKGISQNKKQKRVDTHKQNSSIKTKT